TARVRLRQCSVAQPDPSGVERMGEGPARRAHHPAGVAAAGGARVRHLSREQSPPQSGDRRGRAGYLPGRDHLGWAEAIIQRRRRQQTGRTYRGHRARRPEGATGDLELGARSSQLRRLRVGDRVSDDQQRLVLTAHPLQRIGAFAFAALARARTLDAVSPELFAGVVQRMTDDAVRAALVRDSKRPAGYWLRCSRSFFPNAKMNHPSAARKDDSTLSAEVRRWRQMPHQETWPQAECILCGRRAVGYFGKSDVPLAESDIYRNTTPRGHEGRALCWPSLDCFYALPYGCRRTGGPSIGVHS